MKKVFLLSLLLLMFACFSDVFAQERVRQMDFSDLEESILELPFPKVDYRVDRSDGEFHQFTTYAVELTKVIDYVQKLVNGGKEKHGFFWMGFSVLPGNRYSTSIAKNNEHHYVEISSGANGTVVMVKATAHSFVSGYFFQSLFGYRLGNGLVIPAGEKGEDGL